LITNEEWLLRRPDGASIPILTDAAPILDGKGRIAGGLTVWRDISHRKEIEDKLRETTKLESLGVLAGGVAHVFNNLLTSIIGYASMLIESAPEGSRNGDSARAILESAQTASALTRQMLAYSGRSRFVLERLNLSEVLDQMTQLLRAAAADMVDVRLDLAGDLPPVEADRAQLEQLVMDLLINAVEAIGGGAGRVSIVTRTVELDEAALRAMVGADRARPGRFVLLEFQDTGCGIDDGALPRIFDPFFTTKFTGRGLGLSAALGIVRGHAGGIKVHSAPGVGTTFRVYLPAA
jgi:signal transduction histidine kinase